MSAAIVRVGKKPVSRYINLCLVFFHSGYDVVRIRARGSRIPKAIEIAERVRKYFMRNVLIEKVEIGSDMITMHGGIPRRISTIIITLRRGE
ncbi:MAG: RNA-binding protein [Thermoprotei archaeon]|nr:MAG: RNA-binding protein [Thermoprotei archaeon]RLE80061.1 MAG: RNA-binding protein [Thermoprotei archaeon]